MSDEGIFTGEPDPEIESLLSGVDEGSPDFNDLFSGPPGTNPPLPEKTEKKREAFLPISQLFQEPAPYFKDAQFYQRILTGEGDVSKNIHKNLTCFVKIKDPKERAPYRDRLIGLFWDLLKSITAHSSGYKADPKRLFRRFGILLPNLISAKQRENLSRIIFENNTGEPVHYLDEWLDKVASGRVNPLATDDDFNYSAKNKNDSEMAYKKEEGALKACLHLIDSKQKEQRLIEEDLVSKTRCLQEHYAHPVYSEIEALYSGDQRRILGEISETVRRLSNKEKEIMASFKELEIVQKKLDALEDNLEDKGDLAVGKEIVIHEAESLRKLAKICVGRRGNHLSVLLSNYFVEEISQYATRENVLVELGKIEAVDQGVFIRSFKGQSSRIVPHFIILPCYGNFGVCWEPFERFNRASSRGRIGIPLYPKDLRYVILSAVADLRWQVAKEKAQHYWMQEGLTGEYFQWFTDNKKRGDVKQYFIDDYILWVTKESEGMQKLDKDVRAIFWRQIPFPQELKDNLRNRGFVYDELYKKDINRSISVGY